MQVAVWKILFASVFFRKEKHKTEDENKRAKKTKQNEEIQRASNATATRKQRKKTHRKGDKMEQVLVKGVLQHALCFNFHVTRSDHQTKLTTVLAQDHCLSNVLSE